jgi:hypothetical protein
LQASDAGVKDDFSYTASASPAAPVTAAVTAVAAVPTKQTAGDVSKSLEAIDEVSIALHGSGTSC